ncbi:MAG: DUF6691 family protein, partial [Chloroflexota bacterium]
VGGVFGFVLAAANLSDYTVIHDMLLLREFDVFFLMGSAIGVAAPVLWLMERRRWRSIAGGELVVQKEPAGRATVAGAALFGAGWAIAGTCPGPALVMTAGGSLMGLVVMAGLAVGATLRDRVGGVTGSEREAAVVRGKAQGATRQLGA